MNYFIEGNDENANQSDKKLKQSKLQEIVIGYTNDIYDKISSLITKKTKESEKTTEMILNDLKNDIAIIEKPNVLEQAEIDKWGKLVESIEKRVIELRSNIVYGKKTGASFKIGNDKIVGVINKYL
jgi:cob(I)alamin adenosyltransferase